MSKGPATTSLAASLAAGTGTTGLAVATAATRVGRLGAADGTTSSRGVM